MNEAQKKVKKIMEKMELPKNVIQSYNEGCKVCKGKRGTIPSVVIVDENTE